MKIGKQFSFTVLFLVLLGFTIPSWGQVPLSGSSIPKYVDPLPHFANNRVNGTHSLTITAKEIQQVVLPSTYLNLQTGKPFQTTVWGYEIKDGTTVYPAHYPAFSIEAKRGIPTTVSYFNGLEPQTLYTPRNGGPGILPVDQTLCWADPLSTPMIMGSMKKADMNSGSMGPYYGPAPIVPHLHGAEVSSLYDGYPYAWFTPGFMYRGKDFKTNVYTYNNNQQAATLWFHDHTMGLTRLNVYAGLAGFYLLRDPLSIDTGIPASGGLPASNYEIEIAIQDRMFDTNGQLYFPHDGVSDAHPYWIPMFYGDVMVVNGKTWPYLNVEPRRYRFRFLDGSNARFYDLYLQNMVTSASGPKFWQIGTDGGLLNSPVQLTTLRMAPGERADIIIDFAAYKGQVITLRNSYSCGMGCCKTTGMGMGGGGMGGGGMGGGGMGGGGMGGGGMGGSSSTTSEIMQFRVVNNLIGTDTSYNPATGKSLRTSSLVKLADFTGTKVASGLVVDKTRILTLNDIGGMGMGGGGMGGGGMGMGSLELLVNNTKWMGEMSPNAGGVTENPTEGKTEVWKIVNLTCMPHPMHLHLVQFQLVSRQSFMMGSYKMAYDASFPGGMSPSDGKTYPAGVFIPGYGPPKPYNSTNPIGGNPNIASYLSGSPRPAEKNEAGWKDTFIMYPGEVTTVIVRFAPTDKPINASPGQLLFSFDPSVGPGYVWHCHIVDHEDNEMMRPYSVKPSPSRNAAKLASSGAEETLEKAPFSFALGQNKPNPFNPTTEIHFSIPASSHVELSIYNTLGQKVRSLVNSSLVPGNHTVVWDGKDDRGSTVSGGLYVYVLNSGNSVQSRKMVLMK
jgi:spore coat protein A, manganese oxidase